MLGLGLGLTTLRGRGAGFSPLDIPDIAGWWDASDTATITESGGAVSQVDDKSGNGLHLLQAVAADQPSTGVTTVNGRNALYHAGSEFLQTAVSYNTVFDAGFTLVGMFEHLSGNVVMLGTDSAVRWAYPAVQGDTSTALTSGLRLPYLIRVNGSSETPVTRDDVYNLIDLQANVVTVRFSWGLTEVRGLSPLNYPFNAALQPEMNWCEAFVYDRQLSSDEVAQAESYLAGKWGVTLP